MSEGISYADWTLMNKGSGILLVSLHHWWIWGIRKRIGMELLLAFASRFHALWLTPTSSDLHALLDLLTNNPVIVRTYCRTHILGRYSTVVPPLWLYQFFGEWVVSNFESSLGTPPSCPLSTISAIKGFVTSDLAEELPWLLSLIGWYLVHSSYYMLAMSWQSAYVNNWNLRRFPFPFHCLFLPSSNSRPRIFITLMQSYLIVV